MLDVVNRFGTAMRYETSTKCPKQIHTKHKDQYNVVAKQNIEHIFCINKVFLTNNLSVHMNRLDIHFFHTRG